MKLDRGTGSQGNYMPESLIKKISDIEKSDHTGAPMKARLIRYKRLIPEEINVLV